MKRRSIGKRDAFGEMGDGYGAVEKSSVESGRASCNK